MKLPTLALLLSAACGGSSEAPGSVSNSSGGASGMAGAGQAGAGGTFSAGESGTSGAGSGGESGSAGLGGSGGGGAKGGQGGSMSMGTDLDEDGLDDALESKLALDYAPFFSIDPTDGCKLGGIVYRARPHPQDPSLVLIVYDYLFEKDCGLTGHVGDNEVSAITVDPKAPAPKGIVALRSISHQGTLCEKKTDCGVCPGLKPCDTGMKNGLVYPVIFYSKDKHGSYAQKATCGVLACLDTCTLAPQSSIPLMINAGEPLHPMTTDLTKAGLITSANGWKESTLFAFNPWASGVKFGKAGSVADDLVDPAFETPACKAP